MNGRSQAVRLPKEFRFEGDEVAIRRDEKTGDAVRSPTSREEGWKKFFELLDTIDIPEDFMAERDDRPAEDRKLFG